MRVFNRDIGIWDIATKISMLCGIFILSSCANTATGRRQLYEGPALPREDTAVITAMAFDILGKVPYEGGRYGKFVLVTSQPDGSQRIFISDADEKYPEVEEAKKSDKTRVALASIIGSPCIIQVDEMKLSPPSLAQASQPVELELLPRQHEIGMYVTFVGDLNVGSGSVSGRTEDVIFNLNARAGHTYDIKFKPLGSLEKWHVWIEDLTTKETIEGSKAEIRRKNGVK